MTKEQETYQEKEQRKFDELPDGYKLKRLHEVCINILNQTLAGYNEGFNLNLEFVL
ncbi:MAG: hypothetical protein WC827_03990 [Candidatus Paceibacterota bacterium]|jgi:hypothetical protein